MVVVALCVSLASRASRASSLERAVYRSSSRRALGRRVVVCARAASRRA
jgi:hypothetical protein